MDLNVSCLWYAACPFDLFFCFFVLQFDLLPYEKCFRRCIYTMFSASFPLFGSSYADGSFLSLCCQLATHNQLPLEATARDFWHRLQFRKHFLLLFMPCFLSPVLIASCSSALCPFCLCNSYHATISRSDV